MSVIWLALPDGLDMTETAKGAPVPSENSANGAGSNGHHKALVRRIGPRLLPNRLPPPVNPALGKEAEQRAQSAQDRGAGRSTRWYGALGSVYLPLPLF